MPPESSAADLTAAYPTWSAMVAATEQSNPAVITTDGIWSKGKLFRLAAGGADLLDELGAEFARAIPALLPAAGEAFALLVGAAGSNRVLAPLNPRSTVRELLLVVEPLTSRLLLAAPEFAAVGEQVAHALDRQLVVLPPLNESTRSLDLDPALGAIVVVVHTSGTTGRPKAVALRQDRLAARTRAFADIVAFGPGCVFASASPFHHIAGVGMFLTAMAAGATLVSFPTFSASAWVALRPHGVTHALLVPSMIEALLESGDLGLPSLRSLQYGGSPIRPETIRRLQRELPDVRLTQFLGQTEGSPITALQHEQHLEALRGRTEILNSVGRAVAGVELRIDRPDRRGVGEIWARADHLFVTDENGWLHTGDSGCIDSDGYVYLLGRKADMIIRGGENIYPVEVEDVLLAHPQVREVAVAAVPDDRLGEVVKAFVVAVDPNEPPDVDQLRQFARAQLSGFKVPALWSFVPELPRNPAGKVIRAALTGGEDGSAEPTS